MSSEGQKKADRAVRFINNLRHTKDPWAGKPFDLRPWQENEIVRPLFGKLNTDGTRQYRTCYVEIPRKNGKSELAAAIALYLLFADGERGAEIYSAAADREQASIVFNVAAQMVRQSKTLSKRAKIVDSQKRIIYPAHASFYRAVSADAPGKFGFNAHGIIFDELHTQPNRKLWEALTTSGGTRKQPLIFAITTAGYDRKSICWEKHEDARRTLEGAPGFEEPTLLPVIYAAPPDADWANEKIWYECNPALGDFRNIEEMRTLCRAAQRMPAEENTFRRLYLNQWTQQATRWIPMEHWDACAGEVDVESLRGRPCFAGLDLASTQDITALVLVFPPENGEGYAIIPWFWVPAENIEKRSYQVPYAEWVRQGFIETTPGNRVDYDFILHRIDEAAQRFDIQELAFDRWGAEKISTELANKGMTVVPFGQGWKDMGRASKEFERVLLGHELRHGGNPVLRWMADNTTAIQNPAGWFKPDKASSGEKIDGIVALMEGLARAVLPHETTSVYDTRGPIGVEF